MGAYNRVNGESASASQRLLGDILRRDWGFDGYVVSDCGAIDDIYLNHKIVATPEEAAALGGQRRAATSSAASDLRRSPAARQSAQGSSPRRTSTSRVERLMLARFKLGMFDPPERVPLRADPVLA